MRATRYKPSRERLKISGTIISVFLISALLACSDETSKLNQIEINDNGNGNFSGTAGISFDGRDVVGFVEVTICDEDQVVVEFFRDYTLGLGGFRGRCGDS